MKKLLLSIATVALLLSTACGNKNGNSGQGATESKTELNNDDKGSELITKNQFLEKVWNYQDSPNEWKYLGDKPAIIDFYADWCGPCRIASPILDEVGKEYADKIYVYKIDTQKERELAQVFGISSIPAFLYIPMDGRPSMASGIGRSKEETKEMFISNINKYLLNKE